MAKDQKKRGMLAWLSIHWKRAVPLLALAVVVVVLCFVGGLRAKYVAIDEHEKNQFSANDFYFSIDLLAATDQYAGDDENEITEREIHLYGAGQNRLTFQVRNFFDDLRVNPADITYTVSYSANVSAELTVGGNQVTSGASYTLSKNSKDYDEFTISAPNNTVEGGKITVTVASTVPYVKTMTLTVVLHPQQYDVLYRVEDNAGDPYARLIVMVGKPEGVQVGKINVDWSAINATSNILQVDSTNTFVNLSGVHGENEMDDTNNFVQKFTSKEVVDGNGSVAIYFFKKYPDQNYSMANTVAKEVNGVYQVILNAPATN